MLALYNIGILKQKTSYHSNMKKEEKNNYLERIKILSYLQVLYIRSKFKDDTNKYRNDEIEFAKNYIIDNINKI